MAVRVAIAFDPDQPFRDVNTLVLDGSSNGPREIGMLRAVA